MDLITVFVILYSLLGTVKAQGLNLEQLQGQLSEQEKLTVQLQTKNADLKWKESANIRKDKLIASLQTAVKRLNKVCSKRATAAPVQEIQRRTVNATKPSEGKNRNRMFRLLIRKNPNLKLQSVQKEMLHCLTNTTNE